MTLPPEAQPLVNALTLSFTNPTYQRLSTLLVGALLTTGRRTVANLLRTLRHLAPGHRTAYQHVLSRAPWSGLALGCALVRFLLDHIVPDGPVRLVGDDTVDGHKGAHVCGKARHRDAVRSTHSYTAWRYGHRWVVLAVLVKFPFATRPWALPVLIDPYRSEEGDRARNRPHRTPARIMCGLLRLLLMRLPGRTFIFAGDSGYGTHEVARFCYRHRARLTLVSKLHPDANLFDPPPPYSGKGRPRVKGAQRPKPRAAVAAATTFTRRDVGWYGGGKRTVQTLDGVGHWYKGGCGLVPLRWVFVRDAIRAPELRSVVMDEVAKRKAYPSDLTDEQWELMQIVIPEAKPGGRPRSVDMREVINAMLYLNRSGCQWDMLPHDLPPKSTVYEYFAAWRDDGTWQYMLDVLRDGYRELHAPSGESSPSAASIDSQSVKTTEMGGTRGFDGHKKIRGRKRHIVVDTLGLLLAVVVTGAAVDDARAAPEVLAQLHQKEYPRLAVVWADNKYHNHDLSDWKKGQRNLPWRLEVVSRPDGAKGFVLLPKRWVVERTFAWHGRARHLSKDYERWTESSECTIRLRAIRVILNRSAPNKRYEPFKYRVVKK